MKKLLTIVVTLLLTLIYGEVGAQIKFEKNSHDFGRIAEDGGDVEHIFHLRNISSQPVVLVAAHASCGCTKAEFSRKPIMPDSVASVKIIFKPMNYPGTFARKITIVTSEGALEQPLLVTGYVVPRTKSVEERYPITLCEGLRVTTNAHSFGYVEHGKSKQSTFEMINTSSRTIALSIENNDSNFEFFYPPTIGAGEEVVINFVCSLPDKSDVYGSLSHSVWLVADGVRVRYPFIINGLAIDFRGENVNNCHQMIALSEKSVKFGAVKCTHALRTRTIEVQNCGTKPLLIRKIEMSGDGFEAHLQGDSTIEAGGKRLIEIDIYPSKLPFGAVVERLRVVSNDPKMPVMTIRVSAIVEN